VVRSELAFADPLDGSFPLFNEIGNSVSLDSQESRLQGLGLISRDELENVRLKTPVLGFLDQALNNLGHHPAALSRSPS
jgi:hypothetical protein